MMKRYFVRVIVRAGFIEVVWVAITRPAFNRLVESDKVYLCSYCMSVNQSNEISKLSSIISNLNSVITSLTETIKTLQSSVSNHSPPSNTSTSSSNTAAPAVPVVANHYSAMKPIPDYNRQCNVVVYGITESPPDTDRQTRLHHDIKNALTSFTPINDQLNPSVVKDCYRLGKFNASQSRPRPLMLKFLRNIDAAHILSNRKLLQPPVYVKPDLTLDERKAESLLLKERRALINKGITRNRIKLRNTQLLLDNQPHCTVQNGNLHYTDHSSHKDNNIAMAIEDSPTPVSKSD